MASLPYVLALKALEKLVNEALRYDAGSRQRLAPLTGKRIYIETTRPPVSVLLRIEADHVFLDVESREHPHATIEAGTFELLRNLLLSRELQIVGGPVRIHGDTALVQELHYIAQELDVDWEEPLAQLVGDVAAHQIGNGIRSVMQFARRTARVMFQNSKEYVQEELGAVPQRWELNEFLSDVDDCRADSERVEARLERLAQRIDRLEAGKRPSGIEEKRT